MELKNITIAALVHESVGDKFVITMEMVRKFLSAWQI